MYLVEILLERARDQRPAGLTDGVQVDPEETADDLPLAVLLRRPRGILDDVVPTARARRPLRPSRHTILDDTITLRRPLNA